MFDGATTRARTCPSCDATVGDRTARWCGSCGAPLTSTEGAPDEPTADTSSSGPGRRTLLLGVLAVISVAVVVVVGDRVLGDGSPGSRVQDAAVDAPDEDTLEDVQRRRPAPQPTERPEPRCGARSPDCFLWTAEADLSTTDSNVVTGGDVVTYRDGDGDLTGRDLRDGSVAWTAPGVASADTWTLVAAGDLVLHRDADGLVAREVTTGELRWRNEELAWLEIEEAEIHGDVLMFAGEQPVSDHDAVPRGAVVGGFDAGTGELRWHRSGPSAAQALEVGLVLTDDGRLEAYGPSGDLRWEVTPDLEHAPAYVWAFGHVVSVDDGRDEGRQYLVDDGAPLDLRMMPMGRDEGHTLLAETEPVEDGGGSMQTGRFVLVDGEGPVWDTGEALPDTSGCFTAAQLLAETVSIGDCRGGTIELDRSDGTVVSRTQLADGDGTESGIGRFHIGPYEIILSQEATGAPDGLVLWDTARDTEFATFPPDTWPVLANTPGALTPDLDGVLLLHGQGWLTAIDVGEATGSGAPDAGGSSG